MYGVVADTNVVVSASISDGNSRRFLFEAMLGTKCTLVVSDEIIREIREVS